MFFSFFCLFFVGLGFWFDVECGKYMTQNTNRTINIKNVSKRTSNYSSCAEILTKLIGFHEIIYGEKISLPDEVEINTLIVFKNYFIQFTNDRKNKENHNEIAPSSSHEIKIAENNCDDIVANVKTFWECNQCTYHNQPDSTTCEMCGIPDNVCHHLFHPKPNNNSLSDVSG